MRQSKARRPAFFVVTALAGLLCLCSTNKLARNEETMGEIPHFVLLVAVGESCLRISASCSAQLAPPRMVVTSSSMASRILS